MRFLSLKYSADFKRSRLVCSSVGPEVRFRVEPFDKAIDGENRTFVCEDIAFAYPTPRISLFYTGDSGGSRGEGVSDPNAGLIFTQVAHRVNFTMRVLKSHTKPFVCGAKNKVNSTQSDPLTVDVQCKYVGKLNGMKTFWSLISVRPI